MGKLKKLFQVSFSLALLIGGWQLLVLTGRYEAALLPAPLTVFRGMSGLISEGTLFTHIGVSLSRFMAGYFTAVTLAIVLGLILGWFGKLWSFIDPIVQLIRPVSPIAWFPFIVLWFGIGDLPAIVIIFIAAFFPVLLSTVSAVRKIDPLYLKVARNFGIKQPQIFTKIVFQAAFPFIANGLHIALGSAWVFLVAGEMVGAQSGLGYLIIDARNAMRPDLLVAGILCIGLTGLILDQAVGVFEKWVERQWGILPPEGLS